MSEQPLAAAIGTAVQSEQLTAVDLNIPVSDDTQSIQQQPATPISLSSLGVSARRAQTLPQLPQHSPPATSYSSPPLKSQASNGYFSSLNPSVSTTVSQVSEKDALISTVFVLVKKLDEMMDLTRSDMQSRSLSQSLPVSASPPSTAVGVTSGPKRPWPATIWMRRQWEAVVPHLERYWIALSVFFILAILGVSIGVGWAFRLHTFDIADPQTPPNNAISLAAALIAIDPVGQTMTMDWFASYSQCNVTADPGDCPDVNIYFDEASLRTGSLSSGGPVSSNTKPEPIFFFNATDYYLAIPGAIDGRISSPDFRTILAITSGGTGRTLQSYPFDKYFSQISIFAQNAADNSSVPIAITDTTGLAVGFNADLQASESGLEDQFGTLLKTIVITRGQVVRVYAILVVIAVWLVTLTFIGACITSVFCGKALSASILALPIATLFAFTQLRGTLPGAPVGFGADIDFVGILPCLALLTFCSVFMTAVFLFRDPEINSTRWQHIVGEYEKVQQAKHAKQV